MLFSGVRISCDMFVRNSDLYWETRASSRAFASSECAGLRDLAVLLTSSSAAFSSSSLRRPSSSTLERCSC